MPLQGFIVLNLLEIPPAVGIVVLGNATKRTQHGTYKRADFRGTVVTPGYVRDHANGGLTTQMVKKCQVGLYLKLLIQVKVELDVKNRIATIFQYPGRSGLERIGTI